MKRPLMCLLVTALCLHTIAQSHTAPDIENRKKNQKTMAILPGLTPSGMTRKQQMKLSPEKIADVQDSLGLAFQRTLYSWLTRQGYGNTLEIQDPELTDSLLQGAGLSVKDVIYGKKTDISRVLGVDVLLFSSLHSVQGDKNDVNYGDMTGNDPYQSLNSQISLQPRNKLVTLIINLYDGQDGDPLWDYEGAEYGGRAKYPGAPVLERLISGAFKFYPYKR